MNPIGYPKPVHFVYFLKRIKEDTVVTYLMRIMGSKKIH